MKAIKKIVLYIFLFFVVFVASLVTKLPAYFDSYVLYENYKIKAHIWLIAYRVLIYIVYPLCISIFDKIKHIEFKYFYLLIENFNLQFCAYSILSGIPNCINPLFTYMIRRLTPKFGKLEWE